jgi:hypothetical protein
MISAEPLKPAAVIMLEASSVTRSSLPARVDEVKAEPIRPNVLDMTPDRLGAETAEPMRPQVLDMIPGREEAVETVPLSSLEQARLAKRFEPVLAAPCRAHFTDAETEAVDCVTTLPTRMVNSEIQRDPVRAAEVITVPTRQASLFIHPVRVDEVMAEPISLTFRKRRPAK